MNLNQITIPVTDVVKSIPFYEVLGLKLIVHTHDRYARFECLDGGSSLSLHLVEQMPVGPRTTIYFECPDLDNTVAKLMEKGIQFDTQPVDQTWLWREASLKDPNENPIILYFAGENRLNPPWRKID